MTDEPGSGTPDPAHDPTEVSPAGPDDIALTLTWDLDPDGALKGQLRARNVSDRTVRVAGKPGLRPLGVDGKPLDTDHIVTLEWREPNGADLVPGAEAVARVGWAGWPGPPASGRMVVSWSGGAAEILASGPPQPRSTGPATNLWSSWFDPA